MIDPTLLRSFRRTVIRGALPIILSLPLTDGVDAQESFAFVNVNVVPMNREVVLEGQTVVVEDGVISQIGPAGAIDVPEGATHIDGTGRYLMPGLAEMHAHVPPVPAGSDARPPQDQLDDILFLYLANGITTIRGMLGSSYQLDLRAEIEAGRQLGPAFYVGAPSINGNSAPTPEAAERMVRAAAAAGYDLQKIHPGVSRETWARMAAVAEEVGLSFGGHVPQAVGLEHALATGMSTIDHLDGYMEAAVPEELRARHLAEADVDWPAEFLAALDEDRVRALARETRERGAYVVPTLYLWESIFGEVDPAARLSLPEMRYVSEAQKNAWRNQAAGLQALPAETARAYLESRLRILAILAEEGAGILMGTDSPQLYNVPGFALHREIEVMERAGLSRFDVLRSGTTAVAEYQRSLHGEAGDFGTVEPGRRADLILLTGNPLEDLEHLRVPVGVMVRGRWLDRGFLDQGLARIARKHADGS